MDRERRTGGAVLHVRLEGFGAALAGRRAGETDPGPVVVLEGDTVRDASPAALGRGVRRGMPAWRARRLCPEAAFREWDPVEAARAADRWQAICHARFPRVEPDGWEAAFLAPALLPEAAAAVAGLAAEALPGLGHALRAGAAATRVVARLASAVAGARRPPGPARLEAPAPGARLLLIPAGREEAFLAPLPLAALEGEVSREVLLALRQAGLGRLGDLQRLPAAALRERLGAAEAERLVRLARGSDGRAVAACYPPPEVRVRLPLGGAPLGDEALDRCAGELARRLLAGHRTCTTLLLEVEPEGDAPCRGERILPRPTLDAGSLARHLRALAAGLPPGVRRAVAAVSAVARQPVRPGGWRQEPLWGGEAPREDRDRRLAAALAALRARFGQAVVREGMPPAETWRERRLALWDPWRWRA